MTAQGNFNRTAWAALVACAALLCLAAVAPASALAGSISGMVTDASTTDPVEGLEVCAYPLEEEEEIFEEWFCEKTDASGEYAIEGLEAGEYGVEFWGRPLNYVPQYFDGKSKWWEWDAVVVGSGLVTGIDAEMVEGGGIEGAVDRASGGAPVDSAVVCAWTIESEEFGGCAETDSSGEYAIEGMAAGEYEVEFSAEGLLRQYYDHKAHWWEADPVSVSLGAVTPGIDADLLPAARVEGQVRRASNAAPLIEVEVCAWSTNPEGAFRCAFPAGDGRYSIGGLPADDYKVEFWPYDETLPIQYWDHKASWADANVLSLSSGAVATGIDADLGPPPSAPAVTPPPLFTPPPATKPRPHRKHCKKGFRKKRVKGRVRCVKKKKRKHRRHAQARPGVPVRDVFRPGR